MTDHHKRIPQRPPLPYPDRLCHDLPLGVGWLGQFRGWRDRRLWDGEGFEMSWAPPQENHDPFEGLNWTSKSWYCNDAVLLFCGDLWPMSVSFRITSSIVALVVKLPSNFYVFPLWCFPMFVLNFGGTQQDYLSSHCLRIAMSHQASLPPKRSCSSISFEHSFLETFQPYMGKELEIRLPEESRRYPFVSC